MSNCKRAFCQGAPESFSFLQVKFIILATADLMNAFSEFSCVAEARVGRLHPEQVAIGREVDRSVDTVLYGSFVAQPKWNY